MELRIPDRLLHSLGVGEIDLAQDAVGVRGNKRYFRRVRGITRDENDALNRIVRQFVSAAIGYSIAKAYGVADSWRPHVEIDGLQEAIAVSYPKNVVRRYDDAVGTASSAVCAECADKTGNLIDIGVVDGIDDVHRGFC